MKYRKDFVTNSSSSSFVIAKKYLDEDQMKAIRKNSEMGIRLGIPYSGNWGWCIKEDRDYISGFTPMDNYDIGQLFNVIGVDSDIVKWDENLSGYACLYEDMFEEEEDWRKVVNEL